MRTDFSKLPKWSETPILETEGARQTDPFRGMQRDQAGRRPWWERLDARVGPRHATPPTPATSPRYGRDNEVRELTRALQVLADGMEEENRNGRDGKEEENRAVSNDHISRHFGKAADNIGPALAKFAIDHDVDSPWWRMLRDLLQPHGGKRIGALDGGTYRLANYLVGRMCKA